MIELKDSTVIVTGAAGGIGAATAKRLAEEGVCLILADRDEAAVASVVRGLDGGGHISLGLDLRDISSHTRLVDAAVQTGRPLLGLAHLAAVLRRRDTIDEVTEDDWDVQIDTNLKTTFFLNRRVGSALAAQRAGGSIVNCASQGWWTGGFGGSVVYAASKGGVVSLTRGLARQFAPVGIRVNAIAPGFVDTHMMRGGMTDEQLAACVAQVPLGRFADPAEIGDVVAFLLGPESRYMTGATLNVSGGQLTY